MNWEDTVSSRINDLELIASWASVTELGSVRDHIRLAIADLKRELNRVAANKANAELTPEPA